ncbi:MAG: 3-methyl-2-oxobutanoate hydroxymethyltransferase [Betaproteobacteria bacterium]|nr:MAG: 3-methyl-2-oxobutanoate hydroxymethyltransferase [Betaproteobacteria bacterium]
MAEPKPVAQQPARKKVTIPTLMEKMKKGEPIVQLAVYDYETAIVADRVGIDILCVSDTGGMVLFGHEDTTSVSFEEVMFMAQAVKRGSKYGLRMVDMPYMSFHLSAQQAVDNAAKYVSQGGAEVMKCEGNRHHAKYIEAIIKAGIPVQGHIGITPMRMPQLGGFFAQGKTAERAKGQPGARRAHHRLGPVPPVREAHAAALEDLRRPGADHREGPERLPRRRARAPLPRCRAHRVHEGRRAREVQTNCWKTEKNRLTRRVSWARRAFFPA